jgi:hypothetical protein
MARGGTTPGTADWVWRRLAFACRMSGRLVDSAAREHLTDAVGKPGWHDARATWLSSPPPSEGHLRQLYTIFSDASLRVRWCSFLQRTRRRRAWCLTLSLPHRWMKLQRRCHSVVASTPCRRLSLLGSSMRAPSWRTWRLSWQTWGLRLHAATRGTSASP